MISFADNTRLKNWETLRCYYERRPVIGYSWNWIIEWMVTMISWEFIFFHNDIWLWVRRYYWPSRIQEHELSKKYRAYNTVTCWTPGFYIDELVIINNPKLKFLENILTYK